MDKTELERLAAEERKAYFKAWRAANKEKTAQHRRTYWEKRALAKLPSEQTQEVKANDAGANSTKQ